MGNRAVWVVLFRNGDSARKAWAMKLRAWLAAIGAVATMAGAGCAAAPDVTGTVTSKTYKPDQSFVTMMATGNGAMMPIVMADPPAWLLEVEQCATECTNHTVSVDAEVWESTNVGDQYGESGTE